MGTTLPERKPVVVKSKADITNENQAPFLMKGVKSEPRDDRPLESNDEDIEKAKLLAMDDDGSASPGRDSPLTKDEKSPSKDDSRHVETFVAVIAQAILSAPGKRMTLSSIYHYIASNYSHFNREKGPGWRNSVRHNLSSNDCFVKAVRAENGKGHYWMIHPKDLPEFSKGNFRRRRKPRRPRCHHAVMFNGGNENYFYHALSATSIPLSIQASQERALNTSPVTFNLVDGGKLPLVGHYDRPQYLDMSRTGLALPSSLLWPSEISARTFPKFATAAGSLNFHQLCACHSPGLPCYYHKC
jgi:hypothetical protein